MKRILFSIATISLVGSLAIAVTKAYFSDAVTSSQNTFSTGTMTMEVNSQHPTATAVFTESGLSPGTVIPERSFVVHNTGSLNGNHLDLEVTLSGDTDLAKYIVFSGNTNGLRFGATKDGTQSVRLDVPGWTAGDDEYGLFNGSDGNYITGPNAVAPRPTGSGNGMDRDGDGKVTLADLAVGKVRIAPGTINAGVNADSTGTLFMNGKVDPGMADDMQGKSLAATFTWTLHQDASQY